MRGLAKGSEARADPHGLHLLWLMPKAGASFLETEEAGGRARLQGCPSQTSKTSQILHSLSFSNTQLSQLL